MELELENWYDAFKSKDSKFDGRFFVGVLSTGIYCRPVCKARLPKQENTTFYQSAAAAERDGFRPCLLCRPELAPHDYLYERGSLANKAARIFDEQCSDGLNISEIANLLQCSDRHLRRLFIKEYGVTPLQYLQTRHLLLAKNLLTDTKLSILEVALASGFRSLRSFNEAFKKHYHLAPLAFRKKTKNDIETTSQITLFLDYRPPYRWDDVLAYFKKKALVDVELIKDNAYWRTVGFYKDNHEYVSGWLCVKQATKRNALTLTIDEKLLDILPLLLMRTRLVFDIDSQPDFIFAKLNSLNTIEANTFKLGTRLPGSYDAFETLVKELFKKYYSVKRVAQLLKIIVENYGVRLLENITGLNYTFPLPEKIVSLSLNELIEQGFVEEEAQLLISIATKFLSQNFDFDYAINPLEEIEKIAQVFDLTLAEAQQISLHLMCWPDIFIASQLNNNKFNLLAIENDLEKLKKEWHPFSSYAMISLINKDLNKER
ncbi:helix-turn-helix domain-containing protein [Erysipelotrichaceae bacterium OttesenSCG-928-M19]|nr:helix-turn-helix domain-containing protein [Erysipelotrichaceae bacterium OttesenSCG-928-M19]